MPATSTKAVVKNHRTKHIPLLSDGELDPDTMVIYENACQDHFEERQYPAADQVRKILGGLQGLQVREWFTADRTRIQGLSFLEFMIKFRS